MKNILFIPIFVFILYGSVLGQGHSKDSVVNPIPDPKMAVQGHLNYDFPQFFKETGTFFTQPLRWTGADWLAAGAVTAAAGIAFAIESAPPDSNFFAAQKYYSSLPITIGRMYGEFYTIPIAFAGYAIAWFATGDAKFKKIGYEIGQAGIYAGIGVLAMKSIIGRARPIAYEGHSKFYPFTNPLDPKRHDAFPSGHTTAAFTLTSVLSKNADLPWWGHVLLYIPATMTAISRVYQGNHWISDVVFGAGFGYFVGNWVYDEHERAEAKLNEKSAIEIKSFYPFTISIALN